MFATRDWANRILIVAASVAFGSRRSLKTFVNSSSLTHQTSGKKISSWESESHSLFRRQDRDSNLSGMTSLIMGPSLLK